MNIGFLVPSTSNKQEWNKIEDCFLYKYFLKSLYDTLSNKFNYTIYLGIDYDDVFYSKEIMDEIKKTIEDKNREKKLNIKLKEIRIIDIEKGHVTEIWNKLFIEAYRDKMRYFFQCGDDIYFDSKLNKGKKMYWLDRCIEILEKNRGIGIASPICFPNDKILTQTLVSRRHMEIFKFYFPKQIKNWYCDNWINSIYKNHIYVLKDYIIENRGGKPRYNYIHQPPENLNNLTKLGRKYLKQYLIKKGLEKKVSNNNVRKMIF